MQSSVFPDHADTPALLLAFHTVSRSPSIHDVCHSGWLSGCFWNTFDMSRFVLFLPRQWSVTITGNLLQAPLLVVWTHPSTSSPTWAQTEPVEGSRLEVHSSLLAVSLFSLPLKSGPCRQKTLEGFTCSPLIHLLPQQLFWRAKTTRGLD